MRIKVLYTLFGISLGFLLALGAHSYLQSEITAENIQHASNIIGLEFSPAERDSMIEELQNSRESYQTLRDLELDNSVPPALNFNPIPAGKTFNKTEQPENWNIPTDVALPDDRSDLAFYTVKELASLIKQPQNFSSVELTQFFLWIA
ncbi:MAG: hypothetical protein U5J63_12700 [Fodinibius sp.]|nr:hypothetical protein [Fodinibius sp.]